MSKTPPTPDETAERTRWHRAALTGHPGMDYVSLLACVPFDIRGSQFTAALAAMLACGAVTKRAGW